MARGSRILRKTYSMPGMVDGKSIEVGRKIESRLQPLAPIPKLTYHCRRCNLDVPAAFCYKCLRAADARVEEGKSR